MSKTGCAATAHDFDKFDDATIYCRRCGVQRVMAAYPAIQYLPCTLPHYSTYPTWQPRPWVSPFWYTSTSNGLFQSATVASGALTGTSFTVPIEAPQLAGGYVETFPYEDPSA